MGSSYTTSVYLKQANLNSS